MPSSSSSPSSEDDGIYVVTGATGGLGRRVVARLLARGKHVRAVARDPAKASELLDALPVAAGGKLEVVFSDLAQPKTIPDSLFEPDAATGRAVAAVLSCSAVKVQPKEGDTPDRSKYLQGIKFYDPELADDSPAAVELGGVSAVLQKAARALGASEAGWPLFDAGNAELASPIGELGALDDVVMGGVSRSGFRVVEGAGEGAGNAAPPAGVFSGTLTDANNGGFASVRSRNCDPPLDLSRSSCLALRVSGDGRRYKLILRTDPGWDSLTYCASFDTKKAASKNEFETVRIPWSSFKPVFRARSAVGAPPLDTSRIVSLQLMLSKFEYDGALNPTHTPGAFEFELRVSKIVALAKKSASSSSPTSSPKRNPAFVHVSSAGVTRPNRPGINVDEEPPAVKMNAMLGGLLDYKLAAEVKREKFFSLLLFFSSSSSPTSMNNNKKKLTFFSLFPKKKKIAGRRPPLRDPLRHRPPRRPHRGAPRHARRAQPGGHGAREGVEGGRCRPGAVAARVPRGGGHDLRGRVLGAFFRAVAGGGRGGEPGRGRLQRKRLEEDRRVCRAEARRHGQDRGRGLWREGAGERVEGPVGGIRRRRRGHCRVIFFFFLFFLRERKERETVEERGCFFPFSKNASTQITPERDR